MWLKKVSKKRISAEKRRVKRNIKALKQSLKREELKSRSLDSDMSHPTSYYLLKKTNFP